MSAKYHKAKQAIQHLFEDTNQPQTETVKDLRALRDEIDILIDTLEVDLEDEE